MHTSAEVSNCQKPGIGAPRLALNCQVAYPD